ncbi:MAG TPA: antibiotic biosynthesis monooxygenase [Jiangellales bacterium]|nr:antibiotic biosynthesis monooxygenase [Jiangellales bacterium]
MAADTHPPPRAAAGGVPVTVTVARQVTPGLETEFETWVEGILRAAGGFDGFLGGALLRPPEAGGEWHVVYRFRDDDSLHRWEASPQRAGWLAAAENLVDDERTAAVSGLETWFELPGRTAPAPPRWKMALVTFAAVYPLALLINVLLVPHTTGWPTLLRPVVFAGILVPVMTWVVMPRLTRWLRRWLYPGS